MMLGSDLDDIKSSLVKIRVLSKSTIKMLHSGAYYTAEVVDKLRDIENLSKEIECKLK